MSRQGGFKASQMVVVGVFKVKNNRTEEDSIVHRCALHWQRDAAKALTSCTDPLLFLSISSLQTNLVHITTYCISYCVRQTKLAQTQPKQSCLMWKQPKSPLHCLIAVFFYFSISESVQEEGGTSLLITYVQETIKSGIITLRIVMKRGKHSDKNTMDVWY